MYKIPHIKLRVVRDRVVSYPVKNISGFTDADVVFKKMLTGLPHEEVVAIHVNGRNDILNTQTLAMGGISGCAVTQRDIFRGAVNCGASAILIAHNHPSGYITPSDDDIFMTKSVIAGGKILGIPLLDHLIVADGCHSYSFRDESRLFE